VPLRDHRAGVLLVLDQPGHELHLVGADDLGDLLQSQVVLEPAREDVAVLLPPPTGVGLPHQAQHGRALLVVGDPVQRQQVDDIAFLESHPAQFQPADLRVGRADGVAGRLPADPGVLPEPAQLGAQNDARDGRPVVLPRKVPRRGNGRRRLPVRWSPVSSPAAHLPTSSTGTSAG